MEAIADIVPMAARRYEPIPVERIKIVLPRDREAEQFALNAESIDHVGLMKPIRVNDKFLERTGLYELVCGEGRLLAHQRLGRATSRGGFQLPHLPRTQFQVSAGRRHESPRHLLNYASFLAKRACVRAVAKHPQRS